MNRRFSVVVVLAMALLAVAIWLRQTLADRQGLDALIALQTLLGFGILAAIVLLIRTSHARSRKPIRSKRFQAVRHLRRLLATVWS